MKLAVAMSGGVDSSVAAKILRDGGHDLVGLFLKLWSDPTSPERLRGANPTCKIEKENRCCDYQALEDARMVAARLKIPFYVIDAKAEFKKEVVDYFLKEYQNLRTPNPCIVCNDKIKFDLLLKKALAIGCEKLVTGHFTRIDDKNGIYHLYKGKDETKDQSYMLYRLSQNQLSKIMFPLGEMTKKEVRKLAVKWDLPVKEKPESQEICFFVDKDFRAFLRRYLPKKYFAPGDIVDVAGNIIGKHNGLLNYTIGQRRLLEQEVWNKEQGDKNPLYVIGFNKEKNQIVVGSDEDVYKAEMIVSNLNWISPEASSYTFAVPKGPLIGAKSLSVKIRYHHPEVPCKLSPVLSSSGPKGQPLALTRGSKNNSMDSCFHGNDIIKVTFEKPQRAVTPGQSAVFYLGDEVIGGGIIEK